MTDRRRYLATLQPAPVVDLLLTDDTNPRSVIFQLEAINRHIEALPRPAGGLRTPQERIARGVLTDLKLADIERLCKRVMIIDHGKLLFDGSLTEVTERLGEERILVVDLAEEAAPLQIDGTRLVAVEGARQRLAFKRTETSACASVPAVTACT